MYIVNLRLGSQKTNKKFAQSINLLRSVLESKKSKILRARGLGPGRKPRLISYAKFTI
jgi:hypothetical protein